MPIRYELLNSQGFPIASGELPDNTSPQVLGEGYNDRNRCVDAYVLMAGDEVEIWRVPAKEGRSLVEKEKIEEKMIKERSTIPYESDVQSGVKGEFYKLLVTKIEREAKK